MVLNYFRFGHAITGIFPSLYVELPIVAVNNVTNGNIAYIMVNFAQLFTFESV